MSEPLAMSKEQAQYLASLTDELDHIFKEWMIKNNIISVPFMIGALESIKLDIIIENNKHFESGDHDNCDEPTRKGT